NKLSRVGDMSQFVDCQRIETARKPIASILRTMGHEHWTLKQLVYPSADFCDVHLDEIIEGYWMSKRGALNRLKIAFFRIARRQRCHERPESIVHSAWEGDIKYRAV